jgi:hypothetical protein
MLAFSDSLVREYINFWWFSECKTDREKISRLFRYIQPFKVAIFQHEVFQDPSLLSMLADSPVMKITDHQNERDLVASTKLKLMLVSERKSSDFITIDILNETIDTRFNATYHVGESREKAKLHIRDLLKDAEHIEIVDRYLAKVNRDIIGNITTDNWAVNRGLLKEILPKKSVPVAIRSEDSYRHNQNSLDTLNTHTGDLRQIYPWNILFEHIDIDQNNPQQGRIKTIHDRYIKTDKVEILLSNGLFYLGNSDKDFTYSVKIF